MATRHEITSIQFKADAGKANAAIDSIRQKAKEANEQMAQLRQKLEEGKKANLPTDQIQQMEAELNKATKAARQWDDAQRNLTRGVKALDEAIIQFNRGQGSVEKMSAALSKAARNAAQLQQSRMERGSQGWQEMEALITALDKNLVRARQDFDSLVQTIQSGGRVSVAELTSAKQSLKELSDLTAYGSDEWKGYQAQLDAVTKHYNSLSEAERRLAGEIVTVEDARKRAAAADEWGAYARKVQAEAAKQYYTEERKSAEQRLADSKQQIVTAEQEIATTKEQVATQQQLVSSIQALEDAEDKAEAKTTAAYTAVRQAREEHNKFADAALEAANQVRELEQRLKELEGQGGTPQSNATLEQLKKDLLEAEVKLRGLQNALSASSTAGSRWANDFKDLMSQQGTVTGKAKPTKIKAGDYASKDPVKPVMSGVYHDESGYGVVTDARVLLYDKNLFDASNRGKVISATKAKGLSTQPGDEIEGRYPNWRAVSIDQRFQHSGTADLDALSDFLAGVNEREKQAWKQAKESGETKRTLTEWMDDSSVVLKLPDGQYAILGTGTLTRTVNAAKEMGANEMSWSDSDESALRFSGERGGAIVMRKNRRLEDRQDWAYDMGGTVGSSESPEEIKAKITQLEQEIAAKKKLIEVAEQEKQSAQSSTATDQQRTELQQQLTDAQTKLNEAMAAAEGPTKALDEAEKKLADAEEEERKATEALQQAKGNMNLGEEEDKLDALEKKHDQLTQSLEEQKQAQTELAQNAADMRQKEQDAAIELAQSQNQSEEGLKKSVEILEQQNKTLEAGSTEWRENEAAIGQLNKRIEELKKQSQELRGEVMSLAEAEELADQAMEEQAQTTKTGWAASTEELKRAEQTLAAKVEKAKRGTKEEEAAYQKLVRQLQAVRTELGAGSMSGEQMMAVLSNPKNVTSVDTLKAAIGRARQELDALGRRIDQARQSGQSDEVERLQKIYDELAKSVKNTDIRMKELQNSSKGTASAFDKAWSRLKTYVGLYVGAAVAIQKLTAAMGDLMELSDKMGEVRKTTGMTAEEVGRLSTSLAKLDTRRPLTDLMELSSMAGSIGLKSQEDIQGFTEAANQLTVALPEMGNESARTLMKIADATGDLEKNGGNVRETLERVGSTIIALRANSASAAGPITDFVSRVGAVGAQAGISIDQIAAMGSTIDALGGRVEMSATALSRMIPAIKNNSFAIANAIGITEKELKNLTAIEQMVLIFEKMRDNIGHIDTSTEEGMNAMADNVEQLLGKNTTMREVMKDLEQQGARAGIVFGLLSQNVDTLKEQLGIAANAYRENTALLNEYNNMNETTAAKWERLKNQVEEFFVGDQAQRWLGGIIDGLRKVVDLLTGKVSPAWDFLGITIKTIAVAVVAVRMQFGNALNAMLEWVVNLRTNITKLTASLKAFYAANKANIWTAIAAAAFYAGKAFYDWWQRLNQTVNALAEAEASLSSTTRAVGMMFSRLTQLGKKQDELKQSTKSLRDREAELREELEKLRKKLGEGAEQSKQFKEKQQELEEAHKKVAEAEGKASQATSDRLGLIKEINDKYSTYLGYMLSEASTAETVASAHDLIIAALKEEMYWREQNNAFETVTKQHSENLKDYREASLAELNGMDVMRQQNIMSEWQAMLSSVAYDAKAGGFVIPGAEKAFSSIEDAMNVLKDRFNMVLSNEGGYYMVNPADRQSRMEDFWGESGAGGWGSWTRWADRGFKDWTRESLKVLQETATLQSMSGSAAQRAHETSIQKAVENTNALIAQAQERGNGVTNRQLAEAVVGIEKNLSKYSELSGRFMQFGADTSLKGIANVLLKDLPAETRQAVESEIQRVAASGTSPEPKHTDNPTPYGTYNRVTSPYEEWDADALVARRKEMLERVRTLANGADVQAVLSEDAKFITEATRQNIKTTKEAIEWYNTERLKIQDALHEKHLTNTGDWMDPKKGGKRASKLVQDEMKYYLDELDAYYTERKAKIQEARNDEQITEGEAWVQTIRNESEWQQRRAELQELYAKKREKVTQEEVDAIFNILSERTGETTDYIEKDINNTVKFIEKVGAEKGKPAMDRILGDLDLGIEKAFLRQRNAIGKQVQFMADTLAKERPFNGITENLQENLTKMGILADGVPEKMHFLLGQIEQAYTLDAKELIRRVSEAGFTEWAKQIEGDVQVQQALIAQLRQAYEAVQEAIRKEATRIKKDADMMWKLILLPDGTNLKQATDEAIARMTQQQESVSRANSLIGAGQASENVVSRLAIKQLQLQLSVQQAQFALMRKMGNEKAQYLDQLAEQYEAEGKLKEAERARLDAANVRKSIDLSITEETKKQAELNKQIAKEQEEAQNRLYTELRAWADLLTSSLQSVFEASHAGDAEYYNELAKLNLTGKGGPGAGTYVVIDNAGTSGATAHYEHLDERQALERQREIENQNAVAEAWKKVMDDINMKMSETITDQLNAMLQNASLDANTDAENANTDATQQNTEAILAMTEQLANGQGSKPGIDTSWASKQGLDVSAGSGEASGSEGKTPSIGFEGLYGEGSPGYMPEEYQPLLWDWNADGGADAAGAWRDEYLQRMEAHTEMTQQMLEEQKKLSKGQKDADKTMAASTQSMFAKMTQAANLYGIAYQAMSNENLSTAQKFELMAVQAAGNTAITMLTTKMSETAGSTAADTPAVLSKLWKQLGWGAIPVFAIFTGLLGGLMGLATSKIAKSKSEIAQATGASNSVASGRLVTGMLTYAEGNVNEFTDPASLTPGRSYNVDAADGKTYRARYMGKDAKTHITNGPEFHLVGEAGREAIIDAKTTRLMQMDDIGIWHAIQTLYNGGSLSARRYSRRGRGVRAFADGNLDDFMEEYGDNGANEMSGGMGTEQMAAFQASLDRNSEIMERIAENGIKGVFDVYGKGGLVDSYDTGKKTVTRYGQRY